MDISRDEYHRVPPEDQVFFNYCTQGLPDQKGFRGDGKDKYGQAITFSLGPHAIQWMRRHVSLASVQNPLPAQFKMLEVGFHIGYSSALWLNLLPDVRLLSIEISDKWETLYAAERLGRLYHGRFDFLLGDASKLVDQIRPYGPFSLAFIDGNHLKADLDIGLCRALGIPWMIFDDWWPDPFSTVQAKIKEAADLEVVEETGNMVSARWKEKKTL